MISVSDEFKNHQPVMNADSFKNWLSSYSKHLESVLPKEISIKKKNTIEFKDRTKTVLVGFFMVSILSLLGVGIYAVNTHQYRQETKELLKNNWTNKESNWLHRFYIEVGNKNPKDSKVFINKNGALPRPLTD